RYFWGPNSRPFALRSSAAGPYSKSRAARLSGHDDAYLTAVERHFGLDSRLQTPDSRLPTPDSRLRTQDSRLRTQDSRLPTPDSSVRKTNPLTSCRVGHVV